jgi:hypothetical protein
VGTGGKLTPMIGNPCPVVTGAERLAVPRIRMTCPTVVMPVAPCFFALMTAMPEAAAIRSP